MVTGADLIAALRKVSIRPVTVAGLDVFVRGVNGNERQLIISRAKDGNPLTAPELAALCVCDANGVSLFTAEQAAELAAVDAAGVEEIGKAILAASKLLPDDQDTAAKN
jgi:uncharacterized protein YbjT (DUF2867 family)